MSERSFEFAPPGFKMAPPGSSGSEDLIRPEFLIGLSIMHLVLCFVSFVLEIVNLVDGVDWLPWFGIWTGIFFGFSGAAGLVAYFQKRSSWAVVILFTVSILSICMSIVMMTFGSIGVAKFSDEKSNARTQAVHGVFVFISIVAFITSGVFVKVTSKDVCCKAN